METVFPPPAWILLAGGLVPSLRKNHRPAGVVSVPPRPTMPLFVRHALLLALAAAVQAGDGPRDRVLAVLRPQGGTQLVFAVRRTVPDPHWYANIGYYAERDLGRPLPEAGWVDGRNVNYLPGGRLVRFDLADGATTDLVRDADGGVRDPFVDPDGRSILFSYRQGKGAHYHLFTIKADGSALRRLTDGGYDDIEAVRAADGGIIFVSTRCKRWVGCWCSQVGVIHRAEADGSRIRPLSANIEHDNTPWFLPDGRILYTRWEYVDRSQVDYHHLWAMRPDGTGQTVFYGNGLPGNVLIDAKPVPGSPWVAVIRSPGHGQREHAGALVLLDPTAGPDKPDAIRVVHPENDLRDPWPLAEDLFLAARGPELVAVDGKNRVEVLHRLGDDEVKAGFDLHEPRPLVPHPAPPALPDTTEPASATGRLVLADAHLGRNLQGVQPGEIRRLLVLETLPKPINYTGGMEPLTYGGSFTLERVLGTVPVEPDGSACFDVPALRSLLLVALDDRGLAVKRMQSFLTVQPGEILSCVGCHEQRTRTSLPAAPLAALARAPSAIEPVPGEPEVYDFPRDIQPILDRHCVPCHGYAKTERGGPYAGGVMLAGDHGPLYSHSYFTLTTRALFSDGRNLARSNYAPRQLGSSCSRLLALLDGSHGHVRATPEEIRRVRTWIDAGAPYLGTYAGLGSGMIGGYAVNRQVETDSEWPTTRAAGPVIASRCASCHSGDMALPAALSDERSMSFWRFEQKDPRHRANRHIVFNLTHPEQSLLLLAPLAPEAGGFGICKQQDGSPAAVFASTADADYKTLLAMVAGGADHLASIKRFDMAGFRPRPEYLREMQRYGVLPPGFDPAKDAADGHELDRKYWESLWYRPQQP